MDIRAAEQALIGILLQKPDFLVDVSREISQRDFFCGNASAAYKTILAMWQAKEHVDLVTVATRESKLASYLASAVDVIPSLMAAHGYGREIAKKARERRIAAELKKITAEHATMPDFTLDSLANLYHREAVTSLKECSAKEVVERFVEQVRRNRDYGSAGISTGFDFLDHMHIQFKPGHIWTMGAFTSVGKTAVMTEMLCRVLANGAGSVVVVSTEMTEAQMISRMCANMTGYSSHLIESGRIGGEAGLRVDATLKRIAQMPLIIHDDIYELNDIEAVCRKAQMRGGVNLICIDYVQNCQVPDAKSQYQEQSTLAKRLQKLAKDVEANILALSQVSNDVGRGNTDQLELKGAGEWAAVSDVSIMLRRSKTEDRKLLFSVKKHRHGMKHAGDDGQVLVYENGYTRLVEE